MVEYDNTSQADWNADAIELSVVFGIKLEVAKYLDKWELENCYWSNRSFRRELDAIFTRKKKKLQEDFDKEHGNEAKLEKEEIDELMNTLTKERCIWDIDKSDENKLKFYTANENFYMKLCHVMKRHGLYFRESNDAGFAMGRR